MSSFMIFLTLLPLWTCFRYENKVNSQRFHVNKIPTMIFDRPFRNFGLRSVRPRFERGRYAERQAYPYFPQSLRDDAVVPTELPPDADPKDSAFPGIRSQQINATQVKEDKYPFIAEVIHSPTLHMPHICTAACVDKSIFLTAARCLHSAKVAMTTVIFQGERLSPKAFVLPPRPTKDWFDDIGIIVVDNSSFTKEWITVPIFELHQFNDYPRNYTFFTKLGWLDGIAVGYVVDHETSPSISEHPLYEIPVKISNFLCNYLYNINPPSNDYFVPCYHTCTLAEYYQKKQKCYAYLAGEGHIVTVKNDIGTPKLIGIATWAGYYRGGVNEPPLPVGMAIPNTWMFIKVTLDCAKKIRDFQAELLPQKNKYREACSTYDIRR